MSNVQIIEVAQSGIIESCQRLMYTLWRLLVIETYFEIMQMYYTSTLFPPVSSDEFQCNVKTYGKIYFSKLPFVKVFYHAQLCRAIVVTFSISRKIQLAK